MYPYLHLQIGPPSVSLHFSFGLVHLFGTSAHVIDGQINRFVYIITLLVLYLF
jgi:hypothetical protein